MADILDGEVCRIDSKIVSISGLASRLKMLQEMKVEVIVCCGFNRMFLPLAEALGIRVITGVIGGARDALVAYARGETLPTLCCKGKKGPGHQHRGCGVDRGVDGKWVEDR